MIIKYQIDLEQKVLKQDLKKITNQIYKLLPNREEGLDWEKPLETIIEELSGMNRLLIDQQNLLFPILCKLEGLYTLKADKDFPLYRRIIFECLSLMNDLGDICH